jgi:hypothetical protein
MMKVAFDLDHADWHSHPAETLWADPVPEISPNAFRLRNSPFFVRGVSYLDIVDTTPTEGDALVDFKRIIKRSGHSTYMILEKKTNLALTSIGARSRCSAARTRVAK